MATDSLYYYKSALSVLYLTVCDQQLLQLKYEPENIERFQTPLPEGEIKAWLNAYFSGQQPQQVPAMRASGTTFQQKVWDVMLSIPYGQTLTYGEVSKQLSSAPRAVGQACKRNPIPVLIPCHRIVAKHSVGGYEGATEGHRLNRKKWLIKHEQSN